MTDMCTDQRINAPSRIPRIAISLSPLTDRSPSRHNPDRHAAASLRGARGSPIEFVEPFGYTGIDLAKISRIPYGIPILPEVRCYRLRKTKKHLSMVDATSIRNLADGSPWGSLKADAIGRDIVQA